MKRKPAPKVEIVAVFSDMHVAIIDSAILELAIKWVKDVRPSHLLLNGDTFDLGDFSRHPKGLSRISLAVDEIREGVRIINELQKYCGAVTINQGNHEARWERMIGGEDGRKFEGLLNLSFRDQCQAHGLSTNVRWVRETARTPYLSLVGDVHARHGDKQAGRFGGAINIATNRLNKNQGVSEVVGHHHRAQLAYRTSFGRTSFVMALPTMARDEEYMPNPDWQRGWAALTVVRQAGKSTVVQPSLIIPEAGVAAWGGRVWR